MMNWDDENRNGLEFKPANVTRRFIARKRVCRAPLHVKAFSKYKVKYKRVENGTLKILRIFPYISKTLRRTAEISTSFFAGEDDE